MIIQPGVVEALSYPEARRDDVVDVMHGVSVQDPYRWLEGIDEPEVAAWIAQQNELTAKYIDAIPERAAILARLTDLVNYERFGIPQKAGDRYFFVKNTGLQNQSPLYVSESLKAAPRLLLDPNTLSADGTVALSMTSVSDDGRYLAYAVSSGGSDWVQWRVRDVDTGQDLPDLLSWSKFTGAAWTKDGKGFFYGRYDAPDEASSQSEALKTANYYQKLYYHRIGAEQDQDELIYQDSEHKDWMFNGQPTEDDRYLIMGVRHGTYPENQVYYRALHDPKAPFVQLLNKLDAQYIFLGNDGPVFYFMTDKAAPRKRIVAIDTNRPEEADWKTIVPEQGATLTSASLFGNRIVAQYLQDSQGLVLVFDLHGQEIAKVDLPGIGTVGGFGGKRTDTETFFSFTSYTIPTSIYRYEIENNTVELHQKPSLKFNGDEFVTEQVFFESKDGTKIPMFLTYRKGLKRDGNNPTLITGYGGFNISTTPSFSTPNAVWLEMGGVFAHVVLRGGGDYGRAWYEAGRLANKQNVFDDFIAGAEWLIAEGFTKPSKLACRGGSNGGLLIGAVETQRPDLWGAALPHVGVLDMLRFDKFTIGWAWKSDFGDPAVESDFHTLLKYSPYHNVKHGTAYPPTMIFTGDHDDRVFPAHSFKFAAAMQHAQSGENPILIRVETRAGHGAGKPISKVLDEAADEFSFLVKNLGIAPKL